MQKITIMADCASHAMKPLPLFFIQNPRIMYVTAPQDGLPPVLYLNIRFIKNKQSHFNALPFLTGESWDWMISELQVTYIFNLTNQ
jgi:hypothetical protein